MEITNESIMRDIAGLNGRIRDAEEGLAKLKLNPPKSKKILSRKQKILKDEIKHVQRLISIATEALE